MVREATYHYENCFCRIGYTTLAHLLGSIWEDLFERLIALSPRFGVLSFVLPCSGRDREPQPDGPDKLVILASNRQTVTRARRVMISAA
jgi:hypothetical protein